MIYTVVYFSAATRLFTEPQLLQLLQKSRANNQAKNITGMLLYSEGDFIQILEGEKASVMEMFHKIEKDFRHTSILKAYSGTTESRQFPDWSMGFHFINKEQRNEILGHKNLTSEFFNQLNKKKEHPALTLLKSFYSGLPLYRQLSY